MPRVLIPAPRGALDRTAGQSILIESSPYIRACPIGDARLCLRRASSGQAREPLARSLIPAEAPGAKADCLEPSRRLRLRGHRKLAFCRQAAKEEDCAQLGRLCALSVGGAF